MVDWPLVSFLSGGYNLHRFTNALRLVKRTRRGRLFVYGRPAGSAASAFCFPYNSVTVRRILFKFGRFRQ